LLLVEHEGGLRAALPEAHRIVVFRDLDEAELLVVGRAGELDRVERAALQRRIDVAGGDLLRDGAELAENPAAQPADAELEAVEVRHALDLAAEEAAHLGAGIAAGDGHRIVAGEHLVEEILAAADVPPRIVLAHVEAERQ